MNKYHKMLLILACLCAMHGYAGEPLTLSYRINLLSLRDSVKPEKKHSPKLATIYSAVIPGLGQAYNRKYWKIPIIYAALGISGYYIKYNRDSLRDRQEALNLLSDNDTNTQPSLRYQNLPIEVIKAQRNLYRTNRDYSIIAFAGFYLLNIVDAAVDAHFYKFNIDKPLSMQKHKNWNLYSTRVGLVPAVGFCWRF